MEDTRFGAILLECRVVPERELQHCLEIQSLTGGSRQLGQILVEQGVISQRTLDDLLELQDARRAMQASDAVVKGGGSQRFVRAAVAVGANELHLGEGTQPFVRVAGALQTLGDVPLEPTEVWQLVRDYMGSDVVDRLTESGSVTSDFQIEGLARGRITAFRHFDGLGVTLHLHPPEVRTPESVGLDERLIEAVRGGKGLLLVAGERGSGITETVASIVHEAARQKGRFVVVLDETFEYPAPKDGAIVSLRRVGEHTEDYEGGLRAALREDPDVIVIGETNYESLNLALHAAESGCLVVAVVHARSAVGAMRRILRFYPSYDEARIRSILAATLVGVLTVRLVPGADHGGHELATEIVRCDDGVRDLVRMGSLRQINSLIRLDGSSHGHSMDASLVRLLEQGRVRFEDVFQHAEDKSMLLHSHQSVAGRGQD